VNVSYLMTPGTHLPGVSVRMSTHGDFYKVLPQPLHSTLLYPPASRLTVRLVQSLSSGDQEVLVRALRRPPDCSLKREGLHAVARLLRDHRGKVSASASSLFRSLAEQPRSRERVSCVCVLGSFYGFLKVCNWSSCARRDTLSVVTLKYF
jgi:hypothetical protein